MLIDGRIVQVATPGEIYDRPGTVEVARLFGDPCINLFEVTPSSDGKVAIANVQLPLGDGFGALAGKPCMLGIRPDALTVSTAANGASFPVDVLAETPLNEKSILLMKTAEGREILAALPLAATGSIPHGRAHASFSPGEALLFNAASGNRVERA